MEKKKPVGGGAKKILYTLRTAKKIGVRRSAKALTSKNACKACGLGMGGQMGGMTNEQGQFPSVCNKSVQAQSTDIQEPIPDEVFGHTLQSFNQLSAYELEHLGRLGQPLYKAKNSHKFEIVDWHWALDYAAAQFKSTKPERSFFYSSGRSSNEAGFLLQLMARVYGSNNINNCSYYCHQATSEGLSTTIGTGTATIELADLDGCDLIFVIGANPASNHPRFIHKLKACRDRGGQVVIINPAKESGLVRFALPKSPRSLIAGGSEIASHYLQPRIGSDIALFKGIAKWLIENNACAEQFIHEYTEGFDLFREDCERVSWKDIEQACGLTVSEIATVAQVYARADNAVFAWGMGITHHRHGVANVEYISNLALMRGMLGQPSRGLLPLRGHSNVQGIGTIGVKPVLANDVFKRLQETLGLELASLDKKGLDTLACLEAAASGEMDAALMMGGNLFQATPNTEWAAEALDNIKFKLYLTTTLNKGHINGQNNSEAIILPVAARDEEPEPTTQESMFNFVRLSEGGIERIASVKSEIDILAELAAKITGKTDKNNQQDQVFDFRAFKSRRSIRQTIADVVPGMEALVEIDVAKKEFYVRNRLMHSPTFKTPTAKARFVVHPMPVWREENFSMRLMTVRSEGQFNSIIYEQHDSYRNIKQRWSVMLSHDDMLSLNLRDGDKVTLSSKWGKMSGVAAYAYDLRPGDVMAYYPEANVLVGLERDARSKTPAFKSVAVNVTVEQRG